MRERSFSSVLESLLLLSLAELGLLVLALFLNCRTAPSVTLDHSVSVSPLLSVLWLCCSWQIFNPTHCWSCLFKQVYFVFVACCVAGSLQLEQHQKVLVAWQFLRSLQRQRPCRRHWNGWLLFNPVAQQLKWLFSFLVQASHTGSPISMV